MRAILLSALLASSSWAWAAEQPAPDLGSWPSRHAAAAQSFEAWLRAYPLAARRLFAWDHGHPLRAQSFVEWAAGHPNEGLDAFAAEHGEWPVVQTLFSRHRPALEAFVVWAEAHPDAARELVAKPRGLAWIGNHYADDWKPELEPAAPSSPVQGG